jgi:Mn-dependent DtxR family transcriptional regulator
VHTPVERAILTDLLVYEADKAENIADRTGFHRNSVSRCMSGLVESGLLHHKGGGVYELTGSGRERARGLYRSGYTPYNRTAGDSDQG